MGGHRALRRLRGRPDPGPVTIDTSQDQVVVRYNTSFASRATLTLHTDGVLRGVFRFAFEAKDRQLEYRRVATVAAGTTARPSGSSRWPSASATRPTRPP